MSDLSPAWIHSHDSHEETPLAPFSSAVDPNDVLVLCKRLFSYVLLPFRACVTYLIFFRTSPWTGCFSALRALACFYGTHDLTQC